VFAIFIVNFPAGLIVYWITTNVWTLGQQLLVRKLYPKPEPLDPRDAVDEPAPSRGKPATARALTSGNGKDGKDKPKAKSKAAVAGGDGNGRGAKPPPAPRKKKKRTGRRR